MKLNNISFTYVFVLIVIFQNCEAFARILPGRPTDWFEGITFYADNHGFFANEANVADRDASEIVGLELTDSSLETCTALAGRYTNVVALKWTSKRTDPLPSLILAATNFPKLRYLDFFVTNAVGMPASMSTLTNLTGLIAIGISGPSLTNIDSSIYDLGNLREMWFKLKSAGLPDGISKLKHLKSLMISGKRQIEFGKLPSDINSSTLEAMEIYNIKDVEARMPTLPSNLVELVLSGCPLHEIPQSWSSNRCLQFCTLTQCGLTNFPSQLPEIVTLKFLNLDLNKIIWIPPLNLRGDRQIEISLWANPIKRIAPENQDLVKEGKLEYDGDGQTNRVTHFY